MAVAIVFSLTYVVLAPLAVRQPDLEEALRLAMRMVTLACMSLGILVIIAVLQLPTTTYLPMMLICLVVHLWVLYQRDARGLLRGM